MRGAKKRESKNGEVEEKGQWESKEVAEEVRKASAYHKSCNQDISCCMLYVERVQDLGP